MEEQKTKEMNIGSALILKKHVTVRPTNVPIKPKPSVLDERIKNIIMPKGNLISKSKLIQSLCESKVAENGPKVPLKPHWESKDTLNSKNVDVSTMDMLPGENDIYDFDFNFQRGNTMLESLIFGDNSSYLLTSDYDEQVTSDDTDPLIFDLSKVVKPKSFLRQYDPIFKSKILNKHKKMPIQLICKIYKVHETTVRAWAREDRAQTIDIVTKRLNKKILEWIMEQFFLRNIKVTRNQVLKKAWALRSKKIFKPSVKWYASLLAKYPEICDKVANDALDI